MRARLERFGRWLGARLWLRPALYCLLAVGTVSFAAESAHLLPGEVEFIDVSVDTTKSLLTIIASSMLAVATFAISIMVSTYNTALSSTSPRAFEIVVSDTSTRQAISSFIGAFIFAMVGLIGVSFSYFGSSGRAVLFLMTVAVFLWVVGTLVYWIDHVTRVGQLRHTVGCIGDRVTTLFARHLADLRAASDSRAHAKIPEDALRIEPREAGVVASVSHDHILSVLGEGDWSAEVLVAAGDGTRPGLPVMWVRGKELDDAARARLLGGFDISAFANLDQNPGMGFRVLGEIADRALSPASTTRGRPSTSSPPSSPSVTTPSSRPGTSNPPSPKTDSSCGSPPPTDSWARPSSPSPATAATRSRSWKPTNRRW